MRLRQRSAGHRDRGRRDAAAGHALRRPPRPHRVRLRKRRPPGGDEGVGDYGGGGEGEGRAHGGDERAEVRCEQQRGELHALRSECGQSAPAGHA